jgi:uncharacterized membrane protein YdbT with pleckstrin-like domain
MCEAQHAALMASTTVTVHDKVQAYIHSTFADSGVQSCYHNHSLLARRRMHEELKVTTQSGRLAAQAAVGVGMFKCSTAPGTVAL